MFSWEFATVHLSLLDLYLPLHKDPDPWPRLSHFAITQMDYTSLSPTQRPEAALECPEIVQMEFV